MYENEKDKINKKSGSCHQTFTKFLMFLSQSQRNKDCVSDKTLRYKPIQACTINAFDLRIHRKSLKNRSLYASPGRDPTKAEILQKNIR
jgi:hypothetical protein